MGLRINTNVPALVAQRNLRVNRAGLDRSLERLSSGSRINHAGDDAAGLAISENLRAQLRGLGQAERNAQDGISLVQVAEGAMAEVSNLLIRMRELGVQAASDTVGPTERKFLDVEFQQALEEIDRIANSTEYNGVPLLNGSANALNSVTAVRAEFGAMQNRLQSIINNIMVSRENMASANSRIRDTDLAEETSELTKNQILQQSGIAVLGQANSSIKSALNLLGGGGMG